MSRFIAIDVDASGLFVAAGFARGNSVRIDQAVPILDDPRPLTADTAPEVAKRLKEALAAARIAPAPVLVSVGRDRVVLKDIRHPKTAPTEEPAIVRFQAQRDLAEPPDTLHLDYVPMPAPPGAEDKRATAVFVKKDLFNAARILCESAGLKLAGFTPRPYATAAAVRRAIAAGTATPPENLTAPIGVLTLWDGGGEFVVFQGEHLVFSRSVSGMALQSEGALLGETRRSLAAFAAQSPREKLDALYLSEGHSGGGSWAARLQESLPLPVHPFDPLVGNPAADAVPSHLRGRFTPVVGLLAARGAGPLPINFVTPRQPRAEPSRGRSWVLIGLLLLILLGAGIGGGVYFLHDGLDKRAKAAQARKKGADELLVEEKKTFAKLKAIDDFRNRDVNALDLFWDVTEATPDISKVHMREFDLKFKQPKPEVKAIGGGGGPTTVIGAKPGVAPAPAATPKAAAVEPVAELKLEVVSASDQEDALVQRLVDGLFYTDSRYYSKPYVDRTNQSGKRQATVRVELLPRKADTFTRKFTAVFPKTLPPQPPVEDTTPIFFDEGNQP